MKYKVTYLQKIQLTKQVKIVEAENEEEAISSVKRYGMLAKAELAQSDDEEMAGIVDAEELLYEMDVNNCNELEAQEGYNKTSKVTRAQIEKQLSI